MSTRRLADVGHIPLAESCRVVPVYGKRQRPVVRICFSMGSRIVACGKTQGKNNATKQPMKRLFATPSAKASIAKMEWAKLFAKNVQEEK